MKGRGPRKEDFTACRVESEMKNQEQGVISEEEE
jgi:hypothetical protein